MRKKSELPVKPCSVCGRSFAWRKKWETCWPQVKFCSDACRRGTPRGIAGRAAGDLAPHRGPKATSRTESPR